MCPCLAYAQPEMPGLFYSVVWTAQTLDFCPFLPLTWSEAGRKVTPGAAIDCLQPDQSLGTRPVIGQPPGIVLRTVLKWE